MKSAYSSLSITNTKPTINQSFFTTKALPNNLFCDNALKGSIANSQMYLKKSSSLGKNMIHKKNNSETLFATSSKHINSKKLASSQYVKSSNKTDYSNQSISYQGYNRLKGNQTNSYIVESNKNKERNKPRDRIITELKANYSQDKLRRRKILTVNTDTNDNLNMNSFLDCKDSNNAMNKSNVFVDKRDQPYKLYAGTTIGIVTHSNQNETETNNNISYIKSTDQNKLNTPNKSNHLNTSYIGNSLAKNIDQPAMKKEVINSFNTFTQPTINQLLNELEIEMDKELKDNIAKSKSKKYNTLKHYFETAIKSIGKFSNSRLFQKLLFGYHDVVSNFSVENRELKEGNKLDKANQTIAELEEKNQDKHDEIMQLRNRILELERAHEQVISKSTDNSTQVQESCGTEKEINNIINNAQHNKVIDLNKKNLGDLDALYFLDKVHITRNSSFSNSRNIPKLNLK